MCAKAGHCAMCMRLRLTVLCKPILRKANRFDSAQWPNKIKMSTCHAQDDAAQHDGLYGLHPVCMCGAVMGLSTPPGLSHFGPSA